MNFPLTLILLMLTFLSACSSDKAGQGLYQSSEVGHAKRILPCTVVSSRSVRIRDRRAGDQGESLGFIAGSLATSRHNNAATTMIGGLIGGVVGRAASDKLHERNGVEYTVILSNGEERQLVQDITDGEPLLKAGEACRLQVSGAINRVLPARHYPRRVKRPQRTQLQD